MSTLKSTLYQNSKYEHLDDNALTENTLLFTMSKYNYVHLKIKYRNISRGEIYMQMI